MKNNLELVQYCKNLYSSGARYWFGTFGQVASAALYKTKKQQYPSQYKSSRDKQIQEDIKAKKIVTDCSGLIKGFMMMRENGSIVYTPSLDLGANAYYNQAKEKGNISTIPDIPGLAVWKEGHIGVYIGGGEVIEARGFNYGVQKYRLSDRPYTKWLKIPGLEYITNAQDTISPQPAPEPSPEPKPKTYKVKKGDTLSKIAKANGVTLKALIAANPQIKNPNLIYPNQIINLP